MPMRTASILVLGLLLAGCASTISKNQFMARYQMAYPECNWVEDDFRTITVEESEREKEKYRTWLLPVIKAPIGITTNPKGFYKGLEGKYHHFRFVFADSHEDVRISQEEITVSMPIPYGDNPVDWKPCRGFKKYPSCVDEATEKAIIKGIEQIQKDQKP